MLDPYLVARIARRNLICQPPRAAHNFVIQSRESLWSTFRVRIFIIIRSSFDLSSLFFLFFFFVSRCEAFLYGGQFLLLLVILCYSRYDRYLNNIYNISIRVYIYISCNRNSRIEEFHRRWKKNWDRTTSKRKYYINLSFVDIVSQFYSYLSTNSARRRVFTRNYHFSFVEFQFQENKW